jgi:hypothetical protein
VKRMIAKSLLLPVIGSLAALNAGGQSQWVHFGTNGTLAYFSDDFTNHLIDYSYAGYEGGGVALPRNQPVMQTVSALSGDNTANIQNAINAVGNLAPGTNGIRGVVLLNPGTYEVDGVVTLNKDGVILRGSGTNNTVLNFGGTANSGTAITLAGSGGASQIPGSARYTITDAYVPQGATNFHLNSTSDLVVGTDIVVRRPWTTPWINAIGMSNLWSATGHQNDAERKITAVNGMQVTVDIPLPTPIEQKWCAGTVFPYTDSGRVQQCGVENFTMVSLWGLNTTGNTNGFGWTGIHFGNAKNCWVRDMAFSGFGPAVNAATSSQTKWCTVQDCSYSHGVNNGSARPPAFEIDGQMCLFQRLNGVSGFEHLCQTADEATGPNVYLYCHATGSDFDGGPHRYWGVSLLTDNEYGTVGNVHIVKITGGNNGWGAGYSVFYNCHVNNFTVQCPAVDHHYNWWIGGSGLNNNPSTNPGIYDAAGQTVSPTSLYLEQLKERLGGQAVVNIGYQLFRLSALPPSQTVVPGSNATYTVTVADPMSMGNTVVLGLTGLPLGTSARFNTNSITGPGSATLSISTANSLPVSNYLLTLVGTSAGVTNSFPISLTVMPLPRPSIRTASVHGGTLTFSGNGGLSGETYYVLASTNLTTPVAQWTVVATNTFDANGGFMFANPLNLTVPETFFQLALLPP